MKKMFKEPVVRIIISGITLILLGFFIGCGKDTTNPDNPNEQYPTSNLSYSQHIRPIFLQDCAAVGVCHQSSMKAGGLDLEKDPPDFQGEHGLVVIPFSASNSLLYEVLFQNVENIRQMPPERPALSSAKINAIGTWINEGANTAN
ncbi:MAG: hypothetical protein D6748_15405 [Calditrichaeota bacterium]|nr:MAG: hypothetical protein D6748_15405 [Calditrichota bacterium]